MYTRFFFDPSLDSDNTASSNPTDLVGTLYERHVAMTFRGDLGSVDDS